MTNSASNVTALDQSNMVRDTFGIEDTWPVVTEPFWQWIIEDRCCNGRPAFEKVGVQMTPDVHPYETMKLRLLNAGHSAMGYLGYPAGYEYIYEIIADELHRHAKTAGTDPRPFLGMREIFGDDLPRSQVFVEQVGEALQSLYDGGSKATLMKYI